MRRVSRRGVTCRGLDVLPQFGERFPRPRAVLHPVPVCRQDSSMWSATRSTPATGSCWGTSRCPDTSPLAWARRRGNVCTEKDPPRPPPHLL